MNVEGFWEVRVPAEHVADMLCHVLIADEVPSLSNTGKLGSGRVLMWILGRCPVVAHGM